MGSFQWVISVCPVVGLDEAHRLDAGVRREVTPPKADII